MISLLDVDLEEMSQPPADLFHLVIIQLHKRSYIINKLLLFYSDFCLVRFVHSFIL